MAIILLVLILPDNIFTIGTLYTSSTPGYIMSKRLNYQFGLIELSIMLLGMLETIRLKRYGIYILSFIMFVREAFVFLLQENSIFLNSAYEMYLVIFVGYALTLIVEGELITYNNCDKFFELYLLSNIATIYFNFLIHGADFSGRYNASNLDVGGTGILCVLSILYFLFSESKKYKYTFCIISLIGLFLSGSRANFLFAILIVLIYLLNNVIHNYKNNILVINRAVLNQGILIGIVILLCVGVIWIIGGKKIIELWNNLRIFEMLSLKLVSKDDSVMGRMASLRAGWRILKKYPLGISGFFINLQNQMQLNGYPTYPHSILMSSYILYGPIVIGAYVYLASLLKRIADMKNKYFWLICYIFISTIIYGSPITNFKIIFMLIMVVSLANLSVHDE